jgi:mono/diheme cytochrome c family protein
MRTLLVSLILGAGAGAALAQDAGDRAHGHTLAATVCAACHAVEANAGPSPNKSAPAFVSVANTPGMTAMALNAFIYTPHHLMPDLPLPAADARDLIAYILSLKSTPPL